VASAALSGAFLTARLGFNLGSDSRGKPLKGPVMAKPRTHVPRILAAALLAIGVAATAAGQVLPAQAVGSDAFLSTSDHDNAALVRDLRGDLESYLQAHGAAEHVSAAGLSVSLAGRRATIDVAAGTTRFGGTRPVRTDSIWQIGSNTKAFTAVLILQLEAERRLSVDDTVGRWLPQYPQWRDVTIRRLLNMTSGIPTYDEQPAFLADYASNPHTYFTKERLVSYVAGAPPTSGYSYSNTNYLLAEMIVEKATRSDYRHQLYTRIIGPLGLRDLFYRTHVYPSAVTAREPAGYFFLHEVPQLSGFLGRDVSRNTMSWARGAGGILGTTHELTRWERALYTGALLPAEQQRELLSLVSTRTGQPIDRTSAAEPSGFGLGVQQVTNPKLGTFWVYLGGTFGFRTMHLYFPGSGVIMAMGLNSQPSPDRIGSLAESVYDTLSAHGIIRPAPAPAGAGRS
jgi:D-alanyl-D-alanine carboxypeptidase